MKRGQNEVTRAVQKGKSFLNLCGGLFQHTLALFFTDLLGRYAGVVKLTGRDHLFYAALQLFLVNLFDLIHELNTFIGTKEGHAGIFIGVKSGNLIRKGVVCAQSGEIVDFFFV